MSERKKFISEDNPYTVQFSYIPPQYIKRIEFSNRIITELDKKVPPFRSYFITGVRGCGKTVTMAYISKTIKKKAEWVTVNIPDPRGNIMGQLARGLYAIPFLKAACTEANYDFSIIGIGFSVKKADVIAADENSAIESMLKLLKKMKKKLLITIDEITYCTEVRTLSHCLSAYASEGYSVFGIFTGLKENISAIKNHKSLTFLYRAEERELTPLSRIAIIREYQRTFEATEEEAMKMADMVKGYAFAFQLLGYLYWEALSSDPNAKLEDITEDFDQYLAEFSYDKIWSELSKTEKRIAKIIASVVTSDGENPKIETIRKQGDISSSSFSGYKEALIKKEIIQSSDYGYVEFKLPRFEVYASLQRSS